MRAVTTVEIDVVILTWNDGELLERAVASVLASEGVQPRIFVVDNGSDPPAQVEAPGARVIRNEQNLGVAPGRNQGVRAGDGEVVCLLDSDAELLPASLLGMVTVLRDDATIGLVAPVFVGQTPEDSAGRAPTLGRKIARSMGLTSRYLTTALSVDGGRDVDFAIGACQVFRRRAFDEVGGLDESYFYGPEDVDYCLRVRRAGWRIVQLDDVEVIHPPRRRNRRLLTRRGFAHARAVARHLWRQRGFTRATR